MSKESFTDSHLLGLERPQTERKHQTLEALESLLNKMLTALEDRFDRHLALHKAKENEKENENVKTTTD